MIRERARLERIRTYRRSAAKWPWVLLPWDDRDRRYYAPWDGRFKFRPRKSEQQ